MGAGSFQESFRISGGSNGIISGSSTSTGSFGQINVGGDIVGATFRKAESGEPGGTFYAANVDGILGVNSTIYLNGNKVWERSSNTIRHSYDSRYMSGVHILVDEVAVEHYGDDDTQILFPAADTIRFNAGGVHTDVTTTHAISGSAASTGSFGHIMKGGVNWDTAVSASAAAGGFGGGGGSGTGFPFAGAGVITGSLLISASRTVVGPTTASLHIKDYTYTDTHILSESLVVAVDGNNGRLFSVTDQMTGSIFSANTVAGLPVIEAFSDNKVTLGPFSNQTVIDSDGNIEIGGNISGSLKSTASFGYVTVGEGTPGSHPGADNFRVRAATNQMSRFISTSESTPSSIRVGSNGTYWELSARGDGGGDGATLFYNRANPNGIQIGTDRASVSRDLELGHMTAGGTAGVSLVADGESKLMVKSTGHVGIGTVTPGTLLHVSSSNYGNALYVSGSGGNALVGIGTTSPGVALEVIGSISGSSTSTGSFGRVEATSFAGDGAALTNVPDYVYEPTYELKSINELEEFVTENKHLPNVPDMDNIEKWKTLSVSDRDMLLLEKIEELSLYIIELNKRIKKLENKKE